MLKFDVKRKINTLRDILVGKVPDPKAQVEQITIAMIYKFMDDMDVEAKEFGGERVFFKDEYEKYAWSNLMSPENSGQQRAIIYAEGIEKMVMNENIPQLFRDIFRGAYIPYRDPETLNMFLKEISDFSYDNSEDLGNAFEYLLLIMGSQGDAGQFRTPRHIIDMMVEIVDPKKNDTILDPACGTAGFLISAYKYILKSNVDENGNSTLTTDDRKRLTENFAGYDISPDMVRLSRVNMYLHRFINPNISEYDTLSSEEKWDDNYDVILANPPFMTPKGGIIPHNRYRVKAKRAEVLFVDYIAEHLNPTGKTAIIVPEGIVFQSANAYKELRQNLVNEWGLYAVISLPAGVFNPYSGVKTSILLIDKTLANQKDEILFVKMNNDGFDLGAQRRETKQNDIPDIINVVKSYQKGQDVSNNPIITIASKNKIAEQEYILVGERYKATVNLSTNWDIFDLGTICNIYNGSTPSKTETEYWQSGDVSWFTINDIRNQGRVIYETEQKITQKALEETSVKLLPPNTVLLCCTASVGEYALTKIPLTTNQQFNGLVIKQEYKNKILPEFLFYMSQKFRQELHRLSGQTSFKFVSVKNVKQIKMPIPPLSVQKEIVKEIEGYQKIIDGAKQVVENYNPTIKVDPDWELVPLKSVFKSTKLGIMRSKKEQYDTGIPYIKMDCITSSGFLDFSKIAYINADVEEQEEYSLNNMDFIYNTRNSPDLVGKSAVYEGENGKYLFNNNILRIRFKENANALFVNFYLNSEQGKQKVKRLVNGTTSVAAIYQKDYGTIEIPLPSIEIQNDIVKKIKEEIAIVEQNKSLIEIFERKISDKISEVWGD